MEKQFWQDFYAHINSRRYKGFLAGVILTAGFLFWLWNTDSAEKTAAPILPAVLAEEKERPLPASSPPKALESKLPNVQDPFAVPEAYRRFETPVAAPDKNNRTAAAADSERGVPLPAPAAKPVNLSEAKTIKAIGVVRSEGWQVAILSCNGHSYACGVGQQVASYTVIEIDEKIITIQGMGGIQRLPVGR